MYGRDAINFHVMKKQGLAEPFDSPLEALKALLLIDSSVLPAAYYNLFIRSRGSSSAAIAREVQSGRRIARVIGLKGIPQVVPREVMPHVYSLTKADREGRALVMLHSWGIDDGEYGRVIAGRPLSSQYFSFNSSSTKEKSTSSLICLNSLFLGIKISYNCI
jgi:hypothetical protein